MTSGFDYMATATQLAAYFARQEAAEGARWTSGRLAADSWISALRHPDTPIEILIGLDLLMLEGSDEFSTAWEELRIAYQAWREQR